jgi:hypothetical protein
VTKIQLPDFDDLFELNEHISTLSKKKLQLDLEIKLGEADVTKKVMMGDAYLIKGKPPSMEFIKNSFLLTGFEGELVSLRKEFIEVSSELDMQKMRLQLYRDLIDLYRTESANERAIIQ